MKAVWQEAFSDGSDPPAQAGTREEVGNKLLAILQPNISGLTNFCKEKLTDFDPHSRVVMMGWLYLFVYTFLYN